MLKINDLHVHYGGIHAVKGVSLSIPRGSVVTLIGANGAGKSSIIRSIAGLVKGAKGEVLLTRHEGDQPVQLLGQGIAAQTVESIGVGNIYFVKFLGGAIPCGRHRAAPRYSVFCFIIVQKKAGSRNFRLPGF